MNRFWGIFVPLILIACSRKTQEIVPVETYDLKVEEYFFNVKTKSYTKNSNDEWHLKFVAISYETDFDLGDGVLIGPMINPTILLNSNVSASLDGVNYKYDEYIRGISQISQDSVYVFKTRNRKFVKVKFLLISDSIKALVNDSILFTFPNSSYVDLENLKYKSSQIYRDSTWDVYINGANDIRLNIWGALKFPVKVGKDTIDIYIPETLPSGIDIFRLKSENEDGDSFRTDYYESVIGEWWWKDYDLNTHTLISKGLTYYLRLPDNSVYRVKVLEYNKGFITLEVF